MDAKPEYVNKDDSAVGKLKHCQHWQWWAICKWGFHGTESFADNFLFKSFVAVSYYLSKKVESRSCIS